LLWIVGTLLCLPGCVDVVTTTGPDGKPALVIDCDGESQFCFDKAAELCPGGYYLVNRKNGETEMPHTAGVVATPHTQLTIQCQ
jgi:hypothetical protein